MSLEKQKSPRYERFEQALVQRLEREGYEPVSERFPLAAEELGKLNFQALVKVKAGRSYVVAAVRGDRLAQEQLRYLSDQYYNALVREKNELKKSPTLLRGICIFAFERAPEAAAREFLMQRVRPRMPFAVIRSLPWALDMAGRKLDRPPLTRSPLDPELVLECVDQAMAG